MFERKQAMLDATIYARASNLAVENERAAVAHRDEQNAERFIAQFCAILCYCCNHGLTLGSYFPDGTFTLRRNGMEPAALYILIDGQDGWAYRTCAVDTRYYDGFHRSSYAIRYSDDPTYGQFSL
jgi:hypothetical protein